MDRSLLTIVYDNRLYDKGLKAGWGFSCLIEHLNKKILFDTGDDSEKLTFNLKNLKIEPEDLDAIVLSHNHRDHTGGLQAVLGKNKNCKLYFGKSYPASFQEKVKSQRLNFILVEDVHSIAEGIFVGPEMGGFGPREIPLTVQTDKGLVIITGCAHPGILKMVRAIKKELDKDIYLVLGGFHLEFSLGLNTIVKGLKKIGLKRAAPCHCTGERAIGLFEEKFGKDFVKVGAGLRIEV